jgi:hypothetical protein
VKAARGEPLAVPLQGFLDSPDINQIAANTDDHARLAFSARRSAHALRQAPESAALARAASFDFLRV